MTVDKVTTFVQFDYEDDGDILYAAPLRKAAKLPAFVVTPDMVVGFPDLSEDDIDTILAGPVITDEEQNEYNYGCDMWEVGLVSDNLEGLALMGWMDSEEAFAQARIDERRLFAEVSGAF